MKTVRRPAKPWTESVQALLAHVRARGVRCVPEPLGVDADGCECVSFVPGTVPAYPMPAWVWEEPVLAQAARLMRRLHDATAGFDSAGRTWQLPVHEPAEVVCHNDFAPYNLVCRDGAVAGVIDFEAASPGPRAWDLAYLAYRLVPLTAPGSPDAIATPESVRAARLHALCAAYGDVAPAEVLTLLPARLEELASLARTPPDDARVYRTDATWLGAHPGIADQPTPGTCAASVQSAKTNSSR